ncbi:MAG: hypothetical protein WB755_25390, partial [Terriglobales bacterium]
LNPSDDKCTFTQIILGEYKANVNCLSVDSSDSVKCHLPIEYGADLAPVVADKEAGASWNARGIEKALDF